MMSVQKTFNNLLNSLSSRQKEVIAGRFALDGFKEPQTLAALGKRYSITRERVRQIERSALASLRKEVNANAACADIMNRGKKYLKNSGGVAAKDNFIAELKPSFSDINDNHVELLIEAAAPFAFQPETKDFTAFYFLDKAAQKAAVHFVEEWIGMLKKQRNQIQSVSTYETALRDFAKSKGATVAVAENYLNISKNIHKNPFGDIGLREWPEINPLTIRDRIYLVLKKKGAPLHFESIADTINEVGFDERKALAPTVHNELIKDSRFVLVGRGMYALAEYGYKPGTAKEVIQRILKEKGPMKPKEVIESVQQERFFKPNTVLINLQDKNIFKRLPDGSYHVRES